MNKMLPKTFKLWLLIVACIAGSSHIKAQYTATTLETGKVISGLTKNAAGDIFVVRSAATVTQFQVVKYPNGNPASPQVIYTGLVASASEFPWGIAVNAAGDVFITNPVPSSIPPTNPPANPPNPAWQIVKLAAGSYTPSVIQSGRFFSALAIDASNNLLSMEYNAGNNTYQIVRYAAGNVTGAGTVVWTGLAVPTGDGSYPWNMVLDAAGNIYITDFYGPAKGKVIKLTPSGPNYTPTTLGTGRYFSALAIDGSNNLYTAESVTGTGAPAHIMKYDNQLQGGVEIATGLSFNGFLAPWGLTVMSDGTVYAGDGATGSGRVLKLTPSAPTPASVVATSILDASPTNAGTVRYSITFDKAVSGVTTASFGVSGVTGASITGVSGGPTTYTVTANTGTTASGTLTFSLLGNTVNGITPTISNAPFNSLAGYTIDKTAPTPTITSTTPSPVTGAFTITITFDKPIADNLSVTDLNVIGVTVSNATRVDAQTFTVLLTPPPGTAGSRTVSLPSNMVHDAAGNGNLPSNTYNFSWDEKAPVLAITPPASRYYKAGDVISFTIKYDEDVTVTGAPTLPVIIGGTVRQAAYTAGADARTLIFNYTVVADEQDLDGIDLDAQIALNGGSIKDAVGFDAGIAVANHYSGILVDARPPTVTSVTMPAPGPFNGYYNNTLGTPLVFTVRTSETVTVSGNPTINFTIGTTTRQAVFANSIGNQLIFTYNIVDGDNDEDGIVITSGLQFPGASSIRDAAGNNITPALNGVGDGSGVKINTIHPSVVLTSPVGLFNAPFTATAVFSEAVHGLTTSGFSLTNCTVSSLSTSDNITYTFVVTALSEGPVTVQLPANAAKNKAENGNTASNTLNPFYDIRRPFVNSISVPAGVYKPGDVLTFSSNNSERTSVSAEPYLAFNVGSNPARANINVGLSDGEPVTVFEYTVKAGDYDDDGIQITGNTINLNGGRMNDFAGNPMDPNIPAGSQFFPTVLIDGIAPTVTSVDVPVNGYYRAGDILDFRVHTSELVMVAGTPSLIINIGGVLKAVPFISGNGSSILIFSYTVVPGDTDNDGILLVNPDLNGGVIKDGAGNDMDLTLHGVPSTTGIFVNTNTPSVTLSTTAATLVNAPYTVTATFSEAVTIVTLSDFTATNATLSNLNTSDNTTFTVLVTPVADGPVSLQLPANGAVNIGGNPNSASNILSLSYDGTSPTVTLVAVPVNDYYNTGSLLQFNVAFDEPVIVNTTGGTPSLPITIGSTIVNAAYVSGSGTTTLTFNYTVQDGEMDMDGITLASSAALNGGTITDNVGNNANLTLNNVSSTTNVRVNTAHPSVTLSTTATRINAPFTATITFSEKVSGFTTSDLAITNGTAGTLQTTDDITYTLQVTPVADGAISVNIPAAVAVNIGNNDNTASNTISVTADLTAPLITAGQRYSILANSAVGTSINTARATDASGIIQNWAIASDPSGGAFAIDAATGVITVNNITLLNNQSGNAVTITLTVNDGLNTSVATPVIIDVLPLNQAPTLNPITSVTMCANSSTHTIQLTGASAVEPTQTFGLSVASNQAYFSVLSVTNAGVLSYQLSPNVTAGQATITVTIQDNGGTANGGVDKSQQSFTITVNPLPVITITSDKGNTVSKGEVVHLTATGGATYNWDNAAGIVSGQQTSVLEIRPQANTTYPVTVTSTDGCTSTASINIATVEDFKVEATNILTPNGDGKNDRWVIRNIDSYPDNELKIFDRSGRLVYSQRNYNNTWDGTLNGHPLAEGTYYYFLSISGGAKTAKGYITILLKAN